MAQRMENLEQINGGIRRKLQNASGRIKKNANELIHNIMDTDPRASFQQMQNGASDKLFSRLDVQKVRRALGWFSIALGAAELLAPRAVARISGLEGKNTALLRLFGLRELATGAAIFSTPTTSALPIWARVAGDATDISALGLALLMPKSNPVGVLFALTNVLGVTAVDILTARKLDLENGSVTADGCVRRERSQLINKSPQELYQLWKNFENLPNFMLHLLSVESTGERTSHWIAKAPGGRNVQWDAEIIEDRPNELIAWKSLPGSQVLNKGSVRFELAPNGRGTFVIADIEYRPPGGLVGAGVAWMLREDPVAQLKDDLRRFKQIAETGEIVRSDSTPLGSGQLKQRPAQPIG